MRTSSFTRFDVVVYILHPFQKKSCSNYRALQNSPRNSLGIYMRLLTNILVLTAAYTITGCKKESGKDGEQGAKDAPHHEGAAVSEEELQVEIQGLEDDLEDARILKIDLWVSYPSRAAGMSLEDRIQNFRAIKRIRADIQAKLTAAISVKAPGDISADAVEAETRSIEQDCEDLEVAGIEFQASWPRSANGMDLVRRRRVMGALLTKRAELRSRFANASSSLSIPQEISSETLKQEIEGLEGDIDDMKFSGLPYRATIPMFRANMDAERRRRLFTAIRIKRTELQSVLEKRGSSLKIDAVVSQKTLQEEIDGLHIDIRKADDVGSRLGAAYWPSSISEMDAGRRRRVFTALRIKRLQLQDDIRTRQ